MKRIRFSLTKLLVCSTLVCVLLGVFFHIVRIVRNENLIRELEAYGWRFQKLSKQNGFLASIEMKTQAVGISELKKISGLNEVAIDHANIGATEVAQFQGANLSGLYFEFNRLDDYSLAQLPKLPGLVRLSIRNNSIRGTGLSVLKNSPNLSVLDLSDNISIDDDGIANLPTLPTLKVLSLRHANITDSGVGIVIHKNRSIESLDLIGTEVRSLVDCRLGLLPNLKVLFIGATNLSNESYQYLPQLKNLEELSFAIPIVYQKRFRLNDDLVVSFPRLEKLKVLSLQGNRVTSECLKKFPTLFPKLERLDLTRTDIAEDDIIVAELRRSINSLKLIEFNTVWR